MTTGRINQVTIEAPSVDGRAVDRVSPAAAAGDVRIWRRHGYESTRVAFHRRGRQCATTTPFAVEAFALGIRHDSRRYLPIAFRAPVSGSKTARRSNA